MCKRDFSQEKRRLCVAVVACSLVACVPGRSMATGIPVFDFSNLVNALESIRQLRTQLSQMKQQYQKMDDQYKALTGNRGLGQILNDPSLAGHLPRQWHGIYRRVQAGELPGVSDHYRRIQSDEAIEPSGSAGRQRYESTVAANGALAMAGYDATMARLDNIQALMRQADRTQDAAAKADLQNRMNAEVAMVANEQTRLQLMSQLADVQKELAARAEQREFNGQFLRGAR